jgi:hypothetical protein
MAANEGTQTPGAAPVVVGENGAGAGGGLPLKDIVGTNADGAGVTGESTTSDGVRGLSSSGTGVAGSCGSGVGILGYSQIGPSIIAQGNASAPALIAFGDFKIVPAGGTVAEPVSSIDGSGAVSLPPVADAIKSGPGYAAVLSGKVLITDALAGADATFSKDLNVAGDAKFAAALTATGLLEATKGVETNGDFKTTAGNFITTSGHFTTETGTVTASDVILAGGDCAEQFDAIGAEEIEPGAVLVIDESGALEQCRKSYDRRVAGVVSGAGGLRPGIVLHQRPESRGRTTVALLGKVYCKVDAGFGPIAVGDLLTTSPTPGCAMKAAEPARAFGAVIGKALAALGEGRGLIPILVALQ